MRTLWTHCSKVALLAGLALLGMAHADTVVMKTGQALEGKVLSKTENGLELEVTFGTVFIPASKIRSIEADSPEKLKGRELKDTAAKELVEQMKAEGKVFYKGKWVSEDEKTAELAKIVDEKKKKEEQRLKAKKDAEEAAKKKADEEKKLAAQKLQSQTGTNDAKGERFKRHFRQDPQDSNQNDPNYKNNDPRLDPLKNKDVRNAFETWRKYSGNQGNLGNQALPLSNVIDNTGNQSRY
jgi:hypothetical protein